MPDLLIDQKLIAVCQGHGAVITGLSHEGEPVSGGGLLLTIAGLESTFGARRLFAKLESAYAPGGPYYKNLNVQRLWKVYGCMAACSYGTFQLMFVTATELGFLGGPVELQNDNIGAYWAQQLITKRFIQHQGATTLTHILDAYNSGSFRDAAVPADYIAKGLQLYKSLKL